MIGRDVEAILIQKTNESYKRLIMGDVNYRFPIDRASLKAGVWRFVEPLQSQGTLA